MRLMLVVICLFVLAGCANDRRPTPLPTAALATPALPATLSLPALMTAPEQWSGRPITLIAPLASATGNRVLVPGLGVNGTALAIDDGKRSLWLAEPLPEQMTSQLKDGLNVLKLRGMLSPPGAYGSDGRFPYQFAVDTAAINEPERTVIANLADNPRALEGVLLRVQCFILATADGILLVDELSEGGVPSARARQIKLRDVPDRQLFNQLQQSGEVRYGAVTVTGWWTDGAMTAFEIIPSP